MKVVFICVFLVQTILLCSCGHREERYVVSNDDLTSIFYLLEEIEDKVDGMVEKGNATKGELVELQEDIEDLKSELEYSFFDESSDETLFLR